MMNEEKSENYSPLPALIYVFFSPSPFLSLPLFPCKTHFPPPLYNPSISLSLVFSLSLTTIPPTTAAAAPTK